MKYHQVRVHEYGETCNMYPCEDCDYEGQDIISLQNHVSEAHSSIFKAVNSKNLEDLGIIQLQVYSKLKKQTFPGLIIDEEGGIEVDDYDEEFSLTVVETPEKNVRKWKVTEALIPNKKSKKDIGQTKTKTAFVCDICQASLSRIDSLMRHIKKMHS